MLKLIKQTIHELSESHLMLYFYLLSFIHMFVQSNRDGCQVFGEELTPEDNPSPKPPSVRLSNSLPEFALEELLSQASPSEEGGKHDLEDGMGNQSSLALDNLQVLDEYYQHMSFPRHCLIPLPFELVQYGIEEAAQFFFQCIWQVNENIFTSKQADLLYTIFIVSDYSFYSFYSSSTL